MKRHKHADLIHAYAEGAEIQIKGVDNQWRDLLYPSFVSSYGYRIKPEVEETKPLIDEETRKAIKKLFPDARWLAMDKDGQADVYNMKPRPLDDRHLPDQNDPLEVWRIASLDNYAPDWRTSLVDLNEEVR